MGKLPQTKRKIVNGGLSRQPQPSQVTHGEKAVITPLIAAADRSPVVRQLKSLQRSANRSATNQALKVIQRVPGKEREVKLEQTRDRYKLGNNPLDRKSKRKKKQTVEDSIAARELLRDMGGNVRTALQQLEHDIQEQCGLSSTDTPNSRHLTRALAVREKQTGFAPTVANYTRLLSSEDFTNEASKGALFNDFGALTAALGHGEFTHRLQWYVLAFGMSNGFTQNIANEPPDGFHHCPRDLLININLAGVSFENDEVSDAGMTDQHYLWDALFDRAGMTKGSLEADNEDIGISDPERLMLMLNDNHVNADGPYAEIQGLLTDAAPSLSRIVTKRTDLRRQQAEPSVLGPALNADSFENRKEASNYTTKGRGLLVRDRPQALVGSRTPRDATHVPYAPEVEI